MKQMELKKLVEILDIAVTILGLVCICNGMYKIYPPLGWIAAGVFLAFPDQLQQVFRKRKEVK